MKFLCRSSMTMISAGEDANPCDALNDTLTLKLCGCKPNLDFDEQRERNNGN
jgi:hypothetical protein